MILQRAWWLCLVVYGSLILQLVSNSNNHIIRNEISNSVKSQINYPDDVKACLHELPVVPKEPLPHNTSFNATEERQVLLEIFVKTGGRTWLNNSGWNTSISHCHWHGILCNISSEQVIVISLPSNNLTGTLNVGLWKLRDLQGICLQGNPGLNGTLQDFLSFNMTRLMRLEVSGATITGEIPDKIIQGLKSLIKLQLSGNLFRGVIPPSVGELTELQVFSLGENLIHGSVPHSIGRLSKLWFLDLESLSHLNYTIANFLNLSSVAYMHLAASGLHGTLPDNFGLLFPKLIECLLSDNSLTGTIPSTMQNITHLTQLSLAKNNFHGSIPRGLGHLPELAVLDVCSNFLTGFEDQFVFNSTKLSSLNLANNNLRIELSSLISMLSPAEVSLSILNASSCQLTGDIPNTIWNFRKMMFLDVQSNSLTGTLPSPVSNMLYLAILNFSGNNLTGYIPETYAKVLGLQTFDVSSNPNARHGKDVVGNIPRFSHPDPTSLIRKNKYDHFTCPLIRFKYNNGIIKMDSSYYDSIYCKCDKGFYGHNGHCLHCMPGGKCPPSNSSKFPSYMNIPLGYWPSPNPYNVTQLSFCQRRTVERPACNPSGKCKCWVNVTNDGSYITTCDSKCICHQGSHGRFCSKCNDRYYSHGGICLECPSKKSDKMEILLPVILVSFSAFALVSWLAFFKKNRKWSLVVVILEVIFITLLHVFSLIPAWFFETNILVWVLGVAGNGKKARGILKISIFYFQILDAMTINFEVLPTTVLKMQRYFSNIFNFQFEGLECYFPSLLTPVGKLVSILLLPLFVIIVIVFIFMLYALVCKLLKKSPEKLKKARHFSLSMTIVFLNLLYFPIVKRSFFALLSCRGEDGMSYLPQTPWIDCPSQEYTSMRILGYCSLVVYIIGVPFVVFLPLLMWFLVYRKVTVDGANIADSWLGSLYLPYRKNYQTFIEVFYLCRKAIFASLLTFISYRSIYQTPLLSLAVIIALLLHVGYKPYVCPRKIRGVDVENNLECFILTVLLLSFVSLGVGPDRTLIWLVLALNSSTILLCVIAMVVRLTGKEKYTVLVDMEDR